MNLLDTVNQCKQTLLRTVAEGVETADLSFYENLQEDLFSLKSESKVIQHFSLNLKKFTESRGSERVRTFWELNSFVERLYISLCTFSEPLREDVDKVLYKPQSFREIKYSEIKHLMEAMRARSGSILNLIRESILSVTYKSRQLMPYFVDCLDIRHSETAELIATEIIPYFGPRVINLVYLKVDFSYNAGQERLICVLFSYMKDDEKTKLVSELLQKGDVALQKYILKTYESLCIKRQDLEPLLESRSVELRDLALGVVEKNA